MEKKWEIGGRSIRSRLFVGTGKFSGNGVMREALLAAQTDVVTVALRRVDADAASENILAYVPEGCNVMINTSGARNADEAVRIARLARAGGAGDWIKVEVVADNKYLLPDNLETLKATETLVKEGFVVFPYMNPDLTMGPTPGRGRRRRRHAPGGCHRLQPRSEVQGTGRNHDPGDGSPRYRRCGIGPSLRRVPLPGDGLRRRHGQHGHRHRRRSRRNGQGLRPRRRGGANGLCTRACRAERHGKPLVAPDRIPARSGRPFRGPAMSFYDLHARLRANGF